MSEPPPTPTAGAAGARPDTGAGDDGDLHPALRVVMMPRDTNQYGTIFGGVILSYIDQAAFIEARRHGNHRWVTVSVDRVDFHAPVCVGDVVSFRTQAARLGTKSVTTRIVVEAERYATARNVRVTEALLTMVSVDADGTPIPFRGPATVFPSALEGRGRDGGPA